MALKIYELKEARQELKHSIASTTTQIRALDDLIMAMSGNGGKSKTSTGHKITASKSQKKYSMGVPKSDTITWGVLESTYLLAIGKAEHHFPTCGAIFKRYARTHPATTSSYSSFSALLNHLHTAQYVDKYNVPGQLLRYAPSEKGLALMKSVKVARSA